MSIADDLLAARDLIADEEHWCQGAYAETTDGHSVEPDEPDAARFCSLGALRRATGKLLDTDITHLTDTLAAALGETEFGGTAVYLYNDNHTHAQVMEMWDRAIAYAKDHGL